MQKIKNSQFQLKGSTSLISLRIISSWQLLQRKMIQECLTRSNLSCYI